MDPSTRLQNHDDWYHVMLTERTAEELGIGGLMRAIADGIYDYTDSD